MNLLEGSLHRLSKKYGVDVEYYKEGDLITDEEAGTATSVITKHTLKKCIQLPSLFARNQLGQFTFDTETIKFYIRSVNLVGVTIEKDGYLNTLSCRYNILDIHKYGDDLILEVKEYEGVFPDLITDSTFNTLMMVTSDVT